MGEPCRDVWPLPSSSGSAPRFSLASFAAAADERSGCVAGRPDRPYGEEVVVEVEEQEAAAAGDGAGSAALTPVTEGRRTVALVAMWRWSRGHEERPDETEQGAGLSPN